MSEAASEAASEVVRTVTYTALPHSWSRGCWVVTGSKGGAETHFFGDNAKRDAIRWSRIQNERVEKKQAEADPTRIQTTTIILERDGFGPEARLRRLVVRAYNWHDERLNVGNHLQATYPVLDNENDRVISGWAMDRARAELGELSTAPKGS